MPRLSGEKAAGQRQELGRDRQIALAVHAGQGLQIAGQFVPVACGEVGAQMQPEAGVGRGRGDLLHRLGRPEIFVLMTRVADEGEVMVRQALRRPARQRQPGRHPPAALGRAGEPAGARRRYGQPAPLAPVDPADEVEGRSIAARAVEGQARLLTGDGAGQERPGVLGRQQGHRTAEHRFAPIGVQGDHLAGRAVGDGHNGAGPVGEGRFDRTARRGNDHRGPAPERQVHQGDRPFKRSGVGAARINPHQRPGHALRPRRDDDRLRIDGGARLSHRQFRRRRFEIGDVIILALDGIACGGQFGRHPLPADVVSLAARLLDAEVDIAAQVVLDLGVKAGRGWDPQTGRCGR
uniref:ATP-dependent DNA helicase n=1 Tax=Parastrongyloides trichosuri TaxID=131310 RepID=A0A0N4Z3S7_PARTI